MEYQEECLLGNCVHSELDISNQLNGVPEMQFGSHTYHKTLKKNYMKWFKVLKHQFLV